MIRLCKNYQYDTLGFIRNINDIFEMELFTFSSFPENVEKYLREKPC